MEQEEHLKRTYTFFFLHLKCLLGLSIQSMNFNFFPGDGEALQLPSVGPIGQFFMQISDTFLFSPTTTETLKNVPCLHSYFSWTELK